MSEPTPDFPPPTLPGADMEGDDRSEPAVEPRYRIGSPLAVIALIGVIGLAVAVAWLRQHPQPADFAPLDARIASLEQQVDALRHRPPPTVDLAPLEQRVAALEHRAPAAPPADLGPIDQRLTALEQRPDASGLDQRMTALEHRPNGASPAALAALSTRIDAIAGRQDALAARTQGLETNFGNRLDADEARIGAGAQAAGQVQALGEAQKADQAKIAANEAAVQKLPQLADRAARLARLQAAQTALDNGQPLGELPGAPPALARYAAAKPPTEAQLRLSFPAAASAADAASQPATDGKPFLDRMWARAKTLVTVRRGDQVLLGDPASGITARAQTALDAGDLEGAVAALGSLTGPAANAVAGWQAQARGLLDARAALAAMAAHA